MGNRLFSIFLFLLTVSFVSPAAHAALGSEIDDDSGSSSAAPSSRVPDIPSYGSNPDSGGTSYQSCGTTDFQGNYGCSSVPVPGERPETPNSSTSGSSNNSKNGGTKKKDTGSEKKKGTESAKEPANTCRADYQKYLEECNSSISTTASTCDESNSDDLKAAANSAQTSGQQNSGSSVQNACNQAGSISSTAKNAMTVFRQKCNSALDTCRSKCEDLSMYLQKNPSCYSTLGMTQAQAQSTATSKKNSCEAYQAKVDAADQSIANYGNTGASSAACQMAASGLPTPQESAAEGIEPSKAFCETNPNYPGCVNAASANCSDPSQASNKVCVCAANPRDAMCSSGQSSAEQASASIDSSSRLPTSSDAGMGDIPDTPTIEAGAMRSGSGEGEAVDGQQGSGSPVGSATVGSGTSPRSDSPSEDEESMTVGAGGGGGGRGIFGGGFGGGSSGSGRGVAAGGAGNSATGNQGPDLRQFLPGGRLDPRRIAGQGGVGLDGITGPHSDIWKKIQNRYKILEHSLEP